MTKDNALRMFFSIITGIFVFQVSAYGSTDPDAVETPVIENQQGVNIIKRPRNEGVLEYSSEHNRMGKDYQISWQPVGFTVSPIPSSGINAAVFLDRNSLLQLEFSQGSYPRLLEYGEVTATVIGARYKRFFGNSFYINTGANYRKIELESRGGLFYTSDEASQKGLAESITAGIAIGNQWQFDNFTLGCDWIGLDAAVAKLKSDYKSTGFSSATAEEEKKDWDEISRVATAQLLRFYIGASF